MGEPPRRDRRPWRTRLVRMAVHRGMPEGLTHPAGLHGHPRGSLRWREVQVRTECKRLQREKADREKQEKERMKEQVATLQSYLDANNAEMTKTIHEFGLKLNEEQSKRYAAEQRIQQKQQVRKGSRHPVCGPTRQLSHICLPCRVPTLLAAD